MKKIAVAFLILIGFIVVLFSSTLLYYVTFAPGCSEVTGDSGIPCRAVIAHRGASYDAPEETAPAYLLARDLGVDYLEADIHRTADGVIVALHDDDLERTTNIKDVFPGREKKSINTFTLAELRKLDAGSWYNIRFPERARPSYAGLKILTLEEIITIAEGAKILPGIYLETKSPHLYPGIEEDLLALLGRRGWIGNPEKKGKVILQSFSRESIQKLASLAPDVPRIYLVDQEMALEQGGYRNLVKAAQDLNAGLGPVGYLAYPWHTGPAHRAGRIIHVYTVNIPWQMRLITLFGADGIFTDRGNVLLKLYGRAPGEEPDAILKSHGY